MRFRIRYNSKFCAGNRAKDAKLFALKIRYHEPKPD
jgi:hypothetical protein